MSEVSKNAAIFLATSYQALDRAEKTGGAIKFCNSIVTLIFACFYMEETIDIIIETLNKSDEMHKFLNDDYPGIFKKFAWFFNYYLSDDKKSKDRLLKNQNYSYTMEVINQAFPHFKELYKFRNNISHGKINEIVQNFENVIIFRQAAKDKVTKILNISNLNEMRNITYQSAILNLSESYEENS